MAKPKPVKPKPTKPRPYRAPGPYAGDPDVAGQKEGSAATQFKPGQSGNPAGRAKGTRIKFSEDLVAVVSAHWDKHAQETLDWLFHKKKETYAKVVVALSSKVIEISGDVDHHVHEAIPFDAIIKRCEENKHRDTERKAHLDS